jgi:hypothetical protein
LDSHTAKGFVYGQPIIYDESYKYCVFLENFKLHSTYYSAFMRLSNGGVFKRKTSELHDYIKGYTRFSDTKFIWLRQVGVRHTHPSIEWTWGDGEGGDKNNIYINNPVIYFPGIQPGTKGVSRDDINSGGTDLSYYMGQITDGHLKNYQDNPFNRMHHIFESNDWDEGSNYEYILSDKIKQR